MQKKHGALKIIEITLKAMYKGTCFKQIPYFKAIFPKKRKVQKCLTAILETSILNKRFKDELHIRSLLSWESIPYKQRFIGSSPLWAHIYGGVAQLARAHGSYPWCQGFKFLLRYVFFLLS